ncbi:MAG: nucleotidyltransferase, partial [Flavobacteriaceae bacterium]
NLLVSMNLWKFYGMDLWPALIQCPMHPERLEKELPKAVTIMLNTARIKFQVVNLKEHVPDLTQASDIEQIQAFLEP